MTGDLREICVVGVVCVAVRVRSKGGSRQIEVKRPDDELEAYIRYRVTHSAPDPVVGGFGGAARPIPEASNPTLGMPDRRVLTRSPGGSR